MKPIARPFFAAVCLTISIFIGPASELAAQAQDHSYSARSIATSLELRAHIERAVRPIELSSREYLKQRECFSCHHQAMSIVALTEVRRRGITIDDENLLEQAKRSIEHLRRGAADYRNGKGQGGQLDTAGYALLGLAKAGWQSDSTTDAVVEYLFKSDAGRGRWKVAGDRPPTQSTDLTTTAVALQSLLHFAPNDQKDRTEKRLESLKKWLIERTAKDNEERAFKLFACQALGMHEAVSQLREDILSQQRDDGGWAQTSSMESDAYATGTSLVALFTAGINTSSSAYQRGVQYLMQTQLEDGTWHVVTRSRPIQKYFESGFPHGADQFVSMYASCWATLALTAALPITDQADEKQRVFVAKLNAKETKTSDEPLPVVFTREQLDFFENQVRPVLAGKCASCHGDEKQSGGLRVDTLSALLTGGDSGPAVVMKAPNRSLIIEAIERKSELKMPPEEPLKEAEIAALRKWVEMGLPWPKDTMLKSSDARDQAAKQHWAFQPLTDTPSPQTQQPTSTRDRIDAYVVTQLEKAGLEPSPETSRRNWLRRVYYDLIGLPPSNSTVEQFERTNEPDAYERMVDRLLASPRFGEHWARHWLDVARYSDSKGYVYAREERFFIHASSYRDWVVDALNQDMPYDQFVLLQLAADQVAPNDREAQAGMGFLTLGRRFLGVTPEIVDDRIDVVSRGLLGLTAGCARCHDHKFDPVPTSDYYSLYGVFNNSIEQRVRIETDPLDDAFEKELAKRETAYRDRLQAERRTAAERIRARIEDYLMAQLELEKYPMEGFDIIIAPDDLVPAQVRRVEACLIDAAEQRDKVFELWRRFVSLPRDNFEQRAKALVDELKSQSTSGLNSIVAQQFLTAEPPKSIREVAERYATAFHEIDKPETSKNQSIAGADELKEVLTGATSPFVVPDEDIVSTEQYFDSKTCEALWKLQGEVDRWINSASSSPRYAVHMVDRKQIREPHVFKRGNPRQLGDRVERHFFTALSKPFAQPTETSSAKTTPYRPFEIGSGRLELAQSIVDPRNPLTYRVWINRVWQHVMGQPMVATPSDFGLRSNPPSHPELLDRLTLDFLNAGQDTKQLIRRLVLSSTYRQSSLSSENNKASNATTKDPDNHLLWRANVRRLSFEQQRDTWLTVADGLSWELGGKAATLFDDARPLHRRTIYGTVDRQFLSSVMRVFDFANPDLHIPQRSETTVPQQALFALNHPFTASVTRDIVSNLNREQASSDMTRKLETLFEQILKRRPTGIELDRSQAFLAAAKESFTPVRPQLSDWQYGYGKYDPKSGRISRFKKLPLFTGSAWQGGSKWPDAKLGWVQLTATGGHAGNDLDHAAIRRWVSPFDGKIRIRSTAIHTTDQGNGVRCSIVSSRGGQLASEQIHNREAAMQLDDLAVTAGEAIDFVVDTNDNLNNDQFTWIPNIERIDDFPKPSSGSSAEALHWNAEADFSGPVPKLLDEWQQLAQVLLLSNELLFVD